MPAPKGGESKQGVIIALVVMSVLFVITLVVAILGYTGQSDLVAAEKKANDTAKAQKNSADIERALRAFYRTSLGVAATDKSNQDKDDAIVLAGLKNVAAKDIEAEVAR